MGGGRHSPYSTEYRNTNKCYTAHHLDWYWNSYWFTFSWQVHLWCLLDLPFRNLIYPPSKLFGGYRASACQYICPSLCLFVSLFAVCARSWQLLDQLLQKQTEDVHIIFWSWYIKFLFSYFPLMKLV